MYAYLRLFAKGLWLLLLVLSCASVAQANVYQHIRVEGAKRLTPASVVKRLPFSTQQDVSDQALERALRRLYQTGLFRNIAFARDGQTLILKIEENPTISDIVIESGGEVSNDKLLKMLEDFKIKKGAILNPMVFHSLQGTLANLYREQGFHNVQIHLSERKQSGAKVVLKLKIQEGKEGKVSAIDIQGNHHVSSKDLLGAMTLTPHFWSFLTGNNTFSDQAFQRDREAMRQLYFQHGFLQAKITRHRAIWQGDDVTLQIGVQEGKPFYLNTLSIDGPKDVTKQLQAELVPLKKGDLYHHQHVQKVVQAMHHRLASLGYAFVAVTPRIQLHPKQQRVDLRFQVRLGQRVMVRRIAFSGNAQTQDQVLRREMLQLEASQYNFSLVQQSERQLNNLGYLKDAHCVPSHVAGRSDLIDLICHVEEVPSTVASASAGYSSNAGLIYKVDLNQKNFLGTGRQLTVNAEKSDTVLSANFDLTDPHFLGSNFSNRFHITGSKVKSVKGSTAKYQTNVYEVGYDVGVPVSAYAQMLMGVAYQRTKVVKYDANYPYIKAFIDQHGRTFNTTTLHLGWKSNSYDRVIFPQHGVHQDVSFYVGLPAATNALTYYTLGYKASIYQPVFQSGWTAQWLTQLGYGRGYGDFGKTLPFFKNYWAGGEGSLRGFENNSLGPKDSLGKPMGGNVLATTSVNMFAPSWFGDDKRLGGFVDLGNVFKDHIRASEVRASAGIVFQWRTPLAPLSLSLGYPIRKKDGDQKHAFSFALSTSM